jgi:hypothetical protein
LVLGNQPINPINLFSSLEQNPNLPPVALSPALSKYLRVIA